MEPYVSTDARDSPVYDVSQGIKLAIVFNNKKGRKGTEKDVQAISQTFEELSFELEVLDNPTYTEILQKLQSIQKLKNLSCLALFIAMTKTNPYGKFF